MKVSIVIPNWNGEDKLKRHLPDVLKVEGVDEVVVVDDASSDNSVAVIEENFPQVKCIKKEKNSGFSGAVNTGVYDCSGDIVFLLNSDATPSKGCVKPALRHFTDEKVFSVGCNTGGSWAWGYFKDGFFWHKQAETQPKTAHQTLWVSGGSGFFKKSIWDKLGGLDELFNPFYEEDVDLGYRATKRGYINIWEPDSLVEHYKEVGVIAREFSKAFISKIAQRNQLFFIWKNITSKKLTSQHKKALVKMLLTHPKYWLIFLSARGFLREILKKRTIEVEQNKLTDEEILGKFSVI